MERLMRYRKEDPRYACCPFLPEPDAAMDYRNLNGFRAHPERLYPEALKYAHYVWKRGLPARAILALGRALYCDLKGDESFLQEHPLPYRPLRWMLEQLPQASDDFLGNPRLSFQHQALRLRGERCDQRKWRAWAACHTVHRALPDLPLDPRIRLAVPPVETVAQELKAHGFPGEDKMFLDAIAPV